MGCTDRSLAATPSRKAQRIQSSRTSSWYDPPTIKTEIAMAFKETKGDKTVEACVMPAPGAMFKGYIRVTTTWRNHTINKTIGRGCGRPVNTEAAALEFAEAEARRVLAIK